jgi:hypothetical protein
MFSLRAARRNPGARRRLSLSPTTAQSPRLASGLARSVRGTVLGGFSLAVRRRRRRLGPSRSLSGRLGPSRSSPRQHRRPPYNQRGNGELRGRGPRRLLRAIRVDRDRDPVVRPVFRAKRRRCAAKAVEMMARSSSGSRARSFGARAGRSSSAAARTRPTGYIEPGAHSWVGTPVGPVQAMDREVDWR